MALEKQVVTIIQDRLGELGYYTLRIDGADGPGTQNAIIDFKRNNGLRPRGFFGPVTHDLLFSDKAAPAPRAVFSEHDAPWLAEARRLAGTKEIRGPENNHVIMEWAHNLDQWYPGDDVPWCGLFVAHCMNIGAPDDPQNFNRLGARAWRGFGKKCKPQVGAIAVFWRTHKTKSVNGHVGFIVGEDATRYHILGGNQNDEVNISPVAKKRLLQCRCPSGWLGSGGAMKSVTSGKTSTNEA